MELDEKDKKIVVELLKDADRPQKMLAALTGISTTEFTRRKKALVEAGVIKNYTINVDHEKIGFNSSGYFIFSAIQKTNSKFRDLIEQLKSIPEVVEINQVSGKDMDFIVKIICKKNNDLLLVTEKIRDHENVSLSGAFTALILEVDKTASMPPLEI